MSKQGIMKAIPIILLMTICLILGGIIIARNVGDTYIPTMADGDEDTGDGTEAPDVTDAPHSTDTTAPEPEETEPPETEPVVVASQGLEFTSLGNGTCYVSGVGSCRDSFIIIPTTSPYGETVIGIGDYAFRNQKFIKCVELNEDIKFVGAYAFYGTEIVNAYIPAELEQIGDFAFCNCPELENITVDPANSIYSDVDGVLYSKDMTAIICYPLGKTESSLYISAQVDEIKTMAFYNCNLLKIINYDGAVSSFRRIKVGAGNETFENAVVTYVASGTIAETLVNNAEK